MWENCRSQLRSEEYFRFACRTTNIDKYSTLAIALVLRIFNMHATTSNKSDRHYRNGITPNHITSGGVHLRGQTPGQHCFEETSQRWRFDNAMYDLTGPGIDSSPPIDSNVAITTPNDRLFIKIQNTTSVITA